ncbi:MAG TPA: polymer-forming cytoskeletal protein [Verrucomicrobiae bacterium]|nr:polymer-forming cytoskeletal protein [Verrucomicrobiae bacterium]
MRKWKLALLALALVALPAVVGGIAQATAFRSGEVVKAEKTEKIDHTLFIAGDDVTVEADVNGDVFCAGQTVTINGNVSGDVLCAAQTVRLNGVVEGDVRLAGLDVTVTGNIEGNASVLAQAFVMDSKAKIGKDLTLATLSASINGTVQRDAVISSGEAQINGKVGRDATAAVDIFSLGTAANIAGNVHYYSYAEVQQSAGAKVGGEITRHDPPEQPSEQPATPAEKLIDFIFMTLMILLVSVGLAALFPRMLQNLTAHATQKPGVVALTGAVAIFATPVAIILALLSGIGVLLGGILAVGLMLVVMVSAPLFGHYIGNLIFKSRPNTHPVIETLVGSLILSALFFIPIVNIFAYVITFGYALGVVLSGLVRYNFSQPSEPQAKLVKS